MNAANDFATGEEGQEGPGGPALFGIAITPEIIGIGIAVLGVALAGYLVFQLIMPELDKKTQLEEKIKTTEKQQQDLTDKIKKKTEALAKLEEAKQQKQDVTAMFASDVTLPTLLFDLTQRIREINATVKSDEEKAKILKFEPVIVKPQAPGGAKPGGLPTDTEAAYVVNDDSFGMGVVGKLRRKTYKVEIEGNFNQTKAFLRGLEKMQALLVVKNLKTQLQQQQAGPVEVEWRQGKFIPVNPPPAKLKTSFDLNALLPLKQEATPTPTPQASPSK
jgi:type IV pilus assembly protein PilO